MTKKLNFISLFSEEVIQIGFENAGYNCLLSSDIDADAEKLIIKTIQIFHLLKRIFDNLIIKKF